MVLVLGYISNILVFIIPGIAHTGFQTILVLLAARAVA